jgi:hypothetical protein
MLTLRTFTIVLILGMTTLVLSWPCASVSAQTLTGPQMQTLLPNENDLPGFLRVAPAGENPPAAGMTSPATALHDQIWSPDSSTLSTQPDRSLGGMRRVLYSSDGLYFVEMRLELCTTTKAAQAQLQQFINGSSGIFNKGSFTGVSSIGDQSLFLPADIYGSSLIFRAGNIFVLVSGRGSAGFRRKGGASLVFSPTAVEAIAYQILLRASQQTALTGVSVQNAHLAVNGHALPQNALKVAGRVYVPVQEFAKAMGLTSRWNSKTGALTLTGANRKSITLTAGSTAATIGGAKAAALTVPVLKDGGEPVMTLDDLLRLTGGRITSHAGNTVQVKG